MAGYVERPLVAQLASLGWSTLNWPEATLSDNVGGSSDRGGVAGEADARSYVREPYRSDRATRWLDDLRLNAAIAEIRSMTAGMKRLEANRKSTELLPNGTTAAGFEDWDGGRDRVVNFIDWDHPERYDFLAVSQFPVATPGQ